MCGISGIINFNLKKDQLETRIKFGLKSIYYRGPDKLNYYINNGVSFGTVRLAIENISNGEQPKIDKKNNLVAGFNGEIFNYRSLIKKYNFPKNFSEIDIIVELYKMKGENFLKEIEGQFAIYIYNIKKNKLFLARDRFGIRPLFFYHDKKNFYFGSEIKSIFNLTRQTFSISEKALQQTCLFWTCVNDTTAFNDIMQIEPGNYLVFENSKINIFNYNFYEIKYNFDLRELNLYSEIESAVKRQLQSDVGYACYLSGGIDSSVLAYFLSKNSKKKLDTFSIGFENIEYDESSYQSQISKYLNTSHHHVQISNKDIAENFYKVINHTENFIFRTAPVPMFMLSKLVNNNNHKVVFTGEGADEMLYGYDIFFENKIRRFWSKNKDSLSRPELFKKLYSYLPQFNNPRYFKLSKEFYFSFLNNTDDIFFSHLCRWSQYDQVINYFNIKKNSKSILNIFKKKLNSNFKSYDLNLKAQELEIKSLLSNYLLSSQGDRMSMANSVEGRYPYLDDSFVQKIRTIHPTYLAPGIKSKFLFRKTFEKYLPKEIVYRSKFAYQAPEAHAFVGPNYKSDLFIDFHDNIKKLDMINNKNFSSLLEKIQHPMSTQRLGFRENMSFIIGLSLYCLKSNSNKWLLYE